MPTVKQKPPSDSTVSLLKPLSPSPLTPSHQQPFAPYTNILYYALAALAAILLVRFLLVRFFDILPSWAQGFGRSRHKQPNNLNDTKSCPVLAPVTTASGGARVLHQPFNHRAGFGTEAQILWTAGLLPAVPLSQVQTGGRAASVLGMEEQQGDCTGSRGVSRSLSGSTPRVSSSHSGIGSTNDSRSPRSLKGPQTPSPRGQSNSSDGSARAKQEGKGLMDGHSWGSSLKAGEDATARRGCADGAGHDHEMPTAPLMFSRPPQPPPLTPPTLSRTIFAFPDRRPNYAVSSTAELDGGFIHQPNPDYTASSTSADYQLVEDALSKNATAAIPRRRSYTKTVSIGLPAPSVSNSLPHPSKDIGKDMVLTESISSPSSPLLSFNLPPPLSESYERGISGYEDHRQEEIEVHGEIISLVDEAGHGWTRHTRVYGGGICLACAASGEQHGGGGFYGPKVPLSERR